MAAVFVRPDADVSLDLQLAIPEDASPASYPLSLVARGETDTATLPLDITIGEATPPRLTLETDLPALRGTASTTFTYRLTVEPRRL